jgi:hypothetical protein
VDLCDIFNPGGRTGKQSITQEVSMQTQSNFSTSRFSINLTFIIIILGSALFFNQPLSIKMVLAAPNGVIYVDDDTCPSVGNGSMGDPYCKIQDAVDAALAGEEIRIAAGTYFGVSVRGDHLGNNLTQVVFINKNLTLKGGYNSADWNLPEDPVNNPTIIDAQGQGRGISVSGTGTEEVTLEGLSITGGDYSGLGNPAGISNKACHGTGSDCGGGLYGKSVLLVVKNLQVYGNRANRVEIARSGQGGGVYLYDTLPGTRFENTEIYGNFTPGEGGAGAGMYAQHGYGFTFQNCLFQDNQSGNSGGGLYLFQPEQLTSLEDTHFLNNYAKYEGGGAMMHLVINGPALKMDRSIFSGNISGGQGVGLSLLQQGTVHAQAELTNLLFDNNAAHTDNTQASVIYLSNVVDFTVQLKHITAADNPAYRFLLASTDTDADDEMYVDASNLLMKGFEEGFTGRLNGSGILQIQHTNTLADGVTTMHVSLVGSPVFNAINPLSGDSKLDTTYHLLTGSSAIDAGVDVGVVMDIDKQSREDGLPDIGADEYNPRYDIFMPITKNDD